MKKYFFLQCKRVSKVLPSVMAVTLLLVIGLGALLMGMINSHLNSEENKTINIAITGDLDNEYLKWGIAAVKNFDQSRFSITFLEEPDEKEAQRKLSNGEISAYIVLPDGFVDNALRGDIEPIRFVTTAGAGDIVTMLKDEVTALVTDIVMNSQQGMNGIMYATQDNDIKGVRGELQNKLSIEYLDLILKRGEMIEVEELGIVTGLKMTEYYICGIAILFLMLLGLPFVTVYTGDKKALSSLLVSKNLSVKKQVLGEWLAHLTALVMLCAIVFVLLCLGFMLVDDMSENIGMLTMFFIRFIPVLVMISAFNMMIFEVSANMVSGVMLHFFITLSLCYLSGCFYPVYAFPTVVQKVEKFLPTGAAREFLAGTFNGETTVIAFILIVVFTLLFFTVSLLVRNYKTRYGRGSQT